MARLKLGPIIYLLCITCNVSITNSSSVVNDALKVIKLAKEVTSIIAKAEKIVNFGIGFPAFPLQLLVKTENKLFRKIEMTNSKLDQLGHQIEEFGTNALDTILQTTEDTVRLELRLNDLLKYINRIDVSYQQFKDYTNNTADFERFTLKDFARSVVSHNPASVLNTMAETYTFIVPEETKFLMNAGILASLTKTMKQPKLNFMCNSKQSPQQVLYNLFNTIVHTQLKAYTMGQFAYMILRMYNEGNFTKESKLLYKSFEAKTNSTLKTFNNAMSMVSRELWQCDPEEHQKGETYEELTGLMQGFISNEVNLNSNGKCWDDCPDYNYVTKSYPTCNPGDKAQCYSGRDMCKGQIVHCRSIASEMWICPANQSSYRRYDFIQYENGRTLGSRKPCSRRMELLTEWTDWVFKCPYCFCLCDQHGFKSDRYINLRPVLADIKNNKVVTGLRFVKKNRIIHLTIQEGQLLPDGDVNSTTLHWVPADDYFYNDRKVYEAQDYHVISFANRAVDLDDLEVDDGYVMTGVRFKVIGAHLSLEIYMTKFNFFTGKLENPEGTSVWKDNMELIDKKSEFKLTDPYVPTKSKVPSVPLSKNNEYIKFTSSDMFKDAAQTTVPFLDAQKVEPYHPVPLAGAGLFYKGTNYYGGFIAPKIITYDFSRYLVDKPEI